MCALICSAAMSAATWNVTVPEGTKACYIAGEATGWKHTEMTKVDATHYTITITTDKKDKYKYCSGPDWAYVEKTADGKDVPNRTYSANDEVAKWASIYDPEATVSYVDITIRVKAATAPSIWWWSAGDKCPDAQNVPGMGYDFNTNQPVMTAVEGKTGWFEWNFKDVNASLGVKFKINSGDKEITAKESTCYDATGNVIACDNDDPVVTYDYYIAGNEALTGKNWVADGTGMNKVDDIYTYTFSNVVAGKECQLKITDGTWNSTWGYSDLTVIPSGVNTNKDNNIIFTLSAAGDVTVQFDATEKKITLIGVSDTPAEDTYGIGSNLNSWTPTADPMTVADGVAKCTINLTSTEDFKFAVVKNGKWLKNVDAPITRENNTLALSEIDSWENCTLTPDKTGDYIFTFTIATNALVVTYPMDGPTSISSTEAEVVTTKVIRDGQVLIIRDGVVYNMMGQAIR